MAIKGNFVSVGEAAITLGCTDGHVRQLLITGKLDGEKINKRAWLVSVDSVKAFAKLNITTGRPRKNSA